MNFSVEQLVFDGCAAVCLDFHQRRILPGIFKYDGAFFVGEDIVPVCGQLFEIVAAKRQIGLADGMTVFVHRHDLQQTVGGNDAAVSGGQLLGGKQSKGHGGKLIALADTETLVLFQDLIQRNGGFLPLVAEVGGGFGDLDLLPGIDKLCRVDFGIQYIAGGGCDLPDLVFAEIQRLAFGKSRFIGGHGINDLSGRIAERAVRCDDVLGSGDLVDRTCKPLDRKHRLIDAVRLGNGRKDLAALADPEHALLRRVRLCDLDHRDGVFLCGIVGGHIKIDRLAVQRIAVGSGNLDQRIARAVFQLFGRNKIAVAARIKGVDSGNFGIGESLRDERPVRAVEPEACACQRNDLACFSVHLDDLDIALKIAVVCKVVIGLPVLGDIHIEIGKQLTAVPALGLMHRVDAVGQVFCDCIAVFVADQVVTLGCLGTVIRACGFQENRKLRSGLRCFKLGFAVVGVLDDGDLALDDLFGHIVCRGVVFHGVVFCLCADGINGAVQQVALGGRDLTDGPVIPADIIFRGELSVDIGGVGVHKLVALIDAVDGTGKSGVALRHTRFGIALGDDDIPLFQNVRKALVRDGVPFHRRRLICGDDIADRRIDFFQRVACADQHIGKHGFARVFGHGVFIYRKPRKRSAVEVEFHALVQAVLGGLGHDEGSSLQGVIEIDRCHLTAGNGDTAHFLRLVFVVALLGDGVNAGSKVVDLNDTARPRRDGLVHAVAGDRKRNALYLAVLTGLDDLGAAVADLDVQIALYGVIHRLRIGDGILQLPVRAVHAVRPSDDTAPLRISLFGCNGDGITRRIVRRDGQRVSADRKADARSVCGEGIVGKHTVCVGQRGGVGFAVPFKLNILSFSHRLCKKARHLGMALNACRNGIVIAHDLTVQRVVRADLLHDGAFAARADLVEIGITLTNDRFPNQKLGCNGMSQLVAALVL